MDQNRLNDVVSVSVTCQRVNYGMDLVQDTHQRWHLTTMLYHLLDDVARVFVESHVLHLVLDVLNED